MCWNHNFQPYGSALGWAEFWVSHRMKILQPVPGWDHLPGKSVLLCSDWNFLVVIFLFGLYWQTWMLSKRSQFSKIKIIVPINFISKLLNLLHAFFECWCHLVSCTNTAASLFMQDVFKMLNMLKMFLWKAFFVVGWAEMQWHCHCWNVVWWFSPLLNRRDSYTSQVILWVLERPNSIRFKRNLSGFIKPFQCHSQRVNSWSCLDPDSLGRWGEGVEVL